MRKFLVKLILSFAFVVWLFYMRLLQAATNPGQHFDNGQILLLSSHGKRKGTEEVRLIHYTACLSHSSTELEVEQKTSIVQSLNFFGWRPRTFSGFCFLVSIYCVFVLFIFVVSSCRIFGGHFVLIMHRHTHKTKTFPLSLSLRTEFTLVFWTLSKRSLHHLPVSLFVFHTIDLHWTNKPVVFLIDKPWWRNKNPRVVENF